MAKRASKSNAVWESIAMGKQAQASGEHHLQPVGWESARCEGQGCQVDWQEQLHMSGILLCTPWDKS